MLPGRKHFSHTALPKLYAECREKVKEETHFSTTTDLWSIVLIIVIECNINIYIEKKITHIGQPYSQPQQHFQKHKVQHKDILNPTPTQQ